MAGAGVPTARSVATTDLAVALSAVEEFGVPVVIKADGLAAGKGVAIAETPAEAEAALRTFMVDRSLGDAGQRCLVEEFLEGPELSVFALCDGAHSRLFHSACDYKRLGTGDTGPNTGGMGAYAPPPPATPELLDSVMKTVIEPTAAAMADAGSPMSGVFFAGLMLTAEGPKVLEFNARFGDPETQVMLPLLEDDLVGLLYRTATGDLGSVEAIGVRSGAAVGVVLASGGYPGHYETGAPIDGLGDRLPNTEIFQAGTRREPDGMIVTAGGRVLTVVGTGSDLAAARARAYQRLEGIAFDGMQYRSDIALRELSLNPLLER
jgi:phosphoribosylamine--glycine ligase